MKRHSRAIQCEIRAGYASRSSQCTANDISSEKTAKSDRLKSVSAQGKTVKADSKSCQTDFEGVDIMTDIAKTEFHRGYTTAPGNKSAKKDTETETGARDKVHFPGQSPDMSDSVVIHR